MKPSAVLFMFALAATASAGDLPPSSPRDATHRDRSARSTSPCADEGPASDQDLVRRTMVKFVDPERRIKIPPSRPGVGW